jgi:hypothetical protein
MKTTFCLSTCFFSPARAALALEAEAAPPLLSRGEEKVLPVEVGHLFARPDVPLGHQHGGATLHGFVHSCTVPSMMYVLYIRI